MASKMIWCEEMDAQLRELRDQQLAFYDIALEMGLDQAVVVRRAKELNIPTKAFSKLGKTNAGRYHDNLLKGK